MTPELDDILKSLSGNQGSATAHGDGAALVLAGPGAGKTRVLTARIARILDESRGRNFRVLALTFTTKAASEMRERVDLLVPGLVDRTFIGTFHAFCTQLLRQHGSHLGMSPDFAIFDQDEDREAVLVDALAAAAKRGELVSSDDVRWLKAIDQLKAKLIVPEKAAVRFSDQAAGTQAAKVYQIYEDALKDRNAMDFNGLILGACKLLRDVKGVAARTQRTFPYWLVDEFQDTTPAQYRLLQLAAGEGFKNLFAVADDDQIIYQWAGASFRQIQKFRTDFEPTLIQLVENHRCPPDVVAAANRLVVHNTARTAEKLPLIASKSPIEGAMSVRVFETDALEVEGIAEEIAEQPASEWGNFAVLGRTRAMLVPIQQSLQAKGVKAVIAQRRDRFISPQFTWLQALLDQALRPTDARTFKVLVDAANRVTSNELDSAILTAEADAAGRAYFEHWARTTAEGDNPLAAELGTQALLLAKSRSGWRPIVRTLIPILLRSAQVAEGAISDADDDKAAWDACVKEIRSEKGSELDLDELIQGLALRSKEPPRDPDAVTLLTVHASKGLEFDTVYVVGMAEEVLPSWQSVKKGDTSAEMEEERRNCFVAITRTRQRVILSRAERYRNWAKAPSRFLTEMGVQPTPSTN
ncbi:MAG: ATP-dependent helicase [Pseudomonadota bacterium]|uniref:ATP-dependent helicase n=1 Tax=Phenylobacterium sp. TaxID=1871053 RepID=UPI0025D93FA9|nr:ATP-dependent helicase [Phenylobacterium sp.]MBT9471118.1 ATP-dependent helicase [Phenylobacterium sp.]